MSLIAKIDDGACAAHGDCVDIAPMIFSLSGDVATVIGNGSDDLTLRAAESCPAVAIIVIDEESGEQVYP